MSVYGFPTPNVEPVLQHQLPAELPPIETTYVRLTPDELRARLLDVEGWEPRTITLMFRGGPPKRMKVRSNVVAIVVAEKDPAA